MGNRPGWSEAWRYRILERDDFRCTQCGIGGKQSDWILEVHHINGRDGDCADADENVTTLCVRCHNNQPGHDWRWKIAKHRCMTFAQRRNRELQVAQ